MPYPHRQCHRPRPPASAPPTAPLATIPVPPSFSPLPPHIRMSIGRRGHFDPVLALLDTGASCSVISESCAVRCGLAPIVDRTVRQRFVCEGGVRIQALEKIHQCWLYIGGLDGISFCWPLHVMPNMTTDTIHDILVGMDLLSHWQANIDLHHRQLCIGTRRGLEVPFLSAEDIREEKLARCNL